MFLLPKTNATSLLVNTVISSHESRSYWVKSVRLISRFKMGRGTGVRRPRQLSATLRCSLNKRILLQQCIFLHLKDIIPCDIYWHDGDSNDRLRKAKKSTQNSNSHIVTVSDDTRCCQTLQKTEGARCAYNLSPTRERHVETYLNRISKAQRIVPPVGVF
jgi:hypothetical protein